MMLTRREALATGGGVLAALSLPRLAAAAGGVVEIGMAGRSDGTHVWFDPVGLLVEPGRTIRWTNRDRANVHTATAYHPSVADRPRRIPEAAEPWDSGYLMPGETFELTLTVPGVYDYYCVPHEQAGMVGRIVVGKPRGRGADGRADEGVPAAALEAFPPVDAILGNGTVPARPGPTHGGKR